MQLLNLVIAQLLSAGAVIAVLVSFAYFLRDTVLNYIGVRLAARTSRELASIESSLREREASLLAHQQFALSNISRSEDLLVERRIKAVEALWADAVDLQKHRFLIEILKMLDANNFEKEIADPKFNDFIRTLRPQLSPEKQIVNFGSAVHRPFLSPLAWAYFQGYASIFSIVLVVFISWRNGVKALESVNANGGTYSDILIAILPHRESAIKSMKPIQLLSFIDEVETALLEELRKSLINEAGNIESIERSQRILQAVHLANANNAQRDNNLDSRS